MSVQSMFAEINDKVPEAQKQQVVFRRFSAERAGLNGPRDPNESMSAFERVYRLYTTANDRVEEALGRELSPESALRLQAHQEAFSSKYSSSYGCP